VADDGASTGEMGSYLTATASITSGLYRLHYSFSLTPSQNNNVFEIVPYLDATYQTNIETQRRTGNVADYGVVAASGLIDFTAGQKVTIGIKNLTATQDVTIRNGNVNLSRVG